MTNNEIEERMRNQVIIPYEKSQVKLSSKEWRAKEEMKSNERIAELEAATTKSSTHVETGFVDVPKVEDVTSDGEDDWSVLSDGDGGKGEKSQYATSALSPVVLAKWDTELHQLHELGFLDDRSNVDSLEHLEAAHMGVDSTDKVTVNSVVEHLLDLA